MTILIISCSQNNSIKQIKLETNFQKMENAKIDWPGLYFESDSLVTMINMLNSKGEISESIFYEGLSDTFWTKVIERINIIGSEDTLIDTFVASPITLNESEMVIYFMLFDDSQVKIKRNGQEIFDGTVETFKTTVVLKKIGLKKIELIIDKQSFDLDIRNEYNYIELIHKDSVISCSYLYYMPVN